MRTTIIVLLLILSACTTHQINEEETLKVGLISSFSGDAAEWGNPMRKGFEFAANNGNENIEVIYFDDKCNPKTGLEVANQAVNIHDVDVIAGSVCSSVAFAMEDLIRDNNILYIATGATHPDIPTISNKVFRLWPSDTLEATFMAEHLINNGFQTFAVAYYIDNPSGIALGEQFKQTIEENGGEIVVEATYQSSETELRSHATKISIENPEAIFIAASSIQSQNLAQSLRELQYTGEIYLYSPSVVGALEDLKGLDANYVVAKNVEETTFWEDYAVQSGEAPNVLHAAGYDTYELLDLGLAKCGSDTDCMTTQFKSMGPFQSTRGKLSFDMQGDLQNVEYEILSID